MTSRAIVVTAPSRLRVYRLCWTATGWVWLDPTA
jgi:hypothetical protein